MRSFDSATVAIIAALIVTSTAMADVPRTITYQGRLTDPVGVPFNTVIDMTFRIYASEAGGDVLWTEVHPYVDVANGLFTVQLGSLTPLGADLLDGSVRYLGIQVAGAAMAEPLVPLTSVAYAYRAGQADTADYARVAPEQSSSGWVDGGNYVHLSTESDSVGIGTASPQANLHVVSTTWSREWIESTGIGGAVLGLKTNAGLAELIKYYSGEVALKTGSASRLSLITNSGGSMALRVGGSYAIGIDSLAHVSIGGAVAKNFLDVEGNAVIGWSYAGQRLAPDDGLLVQGDVGIGLYDPNRKLYVADKRDGLSYALKLDNPNSTLGVDGVGVLFSAGGNGSNGLSVDRGKGALVYTCDQSWNKGSFHFLQNSADDNTNPTLADAVMTIKNDGHVGIGTTDPQDALEVNGFVRLDGGVGGGAALRVTEGGTMRWALLYRPWASHKIGFYDEQISHWTLALEQGTGEVGIGTDSPDYTLDVRGTIGNNTTLYHSDIRWKKNVATIEHALDKVARLRGVSYQWRRDEFPEMNFPPGTQLGLVSQEVEEVLPEVVTTGEDGYKDLEYAKLTAVLVEAIKELRQQNESLQRQLNELKQGR